MKILTQLALIFGLCLAGEAIAAVLPIPFPGSVLAMLLLLGLLLCGALKERQVNDAGGWLLDNMAFFFLPPSVALLEQYQLLASAGMLVKRPLVAGEDFVLVGFREAQWQEQL